MVKNNLLAPKLFLAAASFLVALPVFGFVDDHTATLLIWVSALLAVVTIFTSVFVAFGLPIIGAILVTLITFVLSCVTFYLCERWYEDAKRLRQSRESRPPVSYLLDPAKDMNLS